jgi:hypothetical protein
MSISIDKIKQLFSEQFSFVKEKFVIFDQYSIDDARKSKEEYVWHPGVYVFWEPVEGVIKVGRHLTNSRKRALEHITENTGGKMAKLATNTKARLLLFNVKEDKDKHWVAALEIFFEIQLEPEIKSQRLG